MPSRKVLVTGIGCFQTLAMNARFSETFAANGFEPASGVAEADIILCSTCANVPDTENRALAEIERLKAAKKPDALLVITGCLPEINPEKLKTVFTGLTIPARSTEAIAEIIGEPREPVAPFGKAGPVHADDLLVDRLAMSRIWAIPTSAGCQGECTFCAIRFAIGRQRSRPIDDIVADVRAGLDAGYTEFALTGDDNGSYGFDIQTDMAHLLERVFALPRDLRVCVTSFNPWGFSRSFPLLLELARSPKLLRLCVCLQHADAQVLRNMRRFYSAQRVRDQLLALREVRPSLGLPTGFIVGFPGETDRQFESILTLMREVAFEHVLASCYAERPNTTVDPSLPPVPEDVKLERYARLKQESLLALAVRRRQAMKPAPGLSR